MQHTDTAIVTVTGIACLCVCAGYSHEPTKTDKMTEVLF